jgi:hypothetical protein
MKTALLPMILLAVPCCCPEARVIHLSQRHPPLAIAAATDPDSSLHSSDSLEKKAGVPPLDNAASILSLRKRLTDVRSELKELSDYGGFRCYSGVPDPRVTEFTMTDDEKEAFRRTGEDPDAFLEKWNLIRVEDNKKRARWEELTKTESELVVLLEHSEGASQKSNNTEQAVPPNGP